MPVFRSKSDILLSPISTEKSHLGTTLNKYSFYVHKSSTKKQIASAIEHLFSVKVEKLNTLNRIGKEKRFKGKLGCRKSTKIAIATLKDGQQINLDS